jgi:hypothetical protein
MEMAHQHFSNIKRIDIMVKKILVYLQVPICIMKSKARIKQDHIVTGDHNKWLYLHQQTAGWPIGHGIFSGIKRDEPLSPIYRE